MSNKIDDITELDSNQLADKLLNNEMFLDCLISIVTTILCDKEFGGDNKKFVSVRRKLIAKFKKLHNILCQARSLDFRKNIEKYLAQVRGLKAEFMQFRSQLSHDDTTALHCSRAIKILESLTSHVAARKEGKMSSSIAEKCQDLINFKDFTVPPELATQLAYPFLHGTKDGGSKQSHKGADRNGGDKVLAAGGNSSGPPTASGNSITSAANSSNTAHTTAQVQSGNSASTAQCNIPSQPTVVDGSNDNSNPTVVDLPVTFNSTVMGSNSNTDATSTGQSLHNSSNGNVTAQESGDQSNGVHQYNSPTVLIATGDGTTASSKIQPFPHGEAREQIQQETETNYHKYPEGEEVPSVPEVDDHLDHGLTSAHGSGSVSGTETLSPTVSPALVSEVKVAVQQVAVQVFYSTLGEHAPSNQISEPVQTGVLHALPDQITCEATSDSQFITTTASAATKLNSTTYLEATVECNEQCIFGTHS